MIRFRRRGRRRWRRLRGGGSAIMRRSGCWPIRLRTSGGASEISPQTLNDAWITNGMSRYAELMYVEDSSGKTAFEDGGERRFGGRAGV